MSHAEYDPPGTRVLRTDVRYMSRRDLFASAGQFLLVGAAGLASLALVGMLMDKVTAGGPGILVPAVLFCVAILTLMGFAGAFYLFILGCRRARTYDPAVVWAADQSERGSTGAPWDHPGGNGQG